MCNIYKFIKETHIYPILVKLKAIITQKTKLNFFFREYFKHYK